MHMTCKQLVNAAGGRLVLQYFDGMLSKELTLEAVKSDAFALEFARQFADDIDVVTAAIETCCYAYGFASSTMRSNLTLASLALSLAKLKYSDASQLRYVHDLTFSDNKLVNADCASLVSHPWNYISESLKLATSSALSAPGTSASIASYSAKDSFCVA
jgi:hypothetical protein